jgi:DNA-binding GntR family transcriptional regulator
MLNKYSGIPLYLQLKNLIIEKIESGEYEESSKIPSEQELCEMYNISRPTVRQAISELTNNGYLYKEKGKGTFVAKPKSQIDIKDFKGFSDSILDCPVPGEKEIISANELDINDYPKLNNIFGIPKNQSSKFAQITYVTKGASDVLSLTTNYLPLVLFPSIIDDIKEKKPSYDILSGKYSLVPFKSRSTLEIIYCDHADSQYLCVQAGQALLKVESILTSRSGQVVELVISKYCADKCRFVFRDSK